MTQIYEGQLGLHRQSKIVGDKDDIATYGSDYVHLCRKLKSLTSIDLEHYKGQQMHRRLQTYRARSAMPDFAHLARAIETDSRKLDSLVDYLTINVSQFFRNEEQWEALRGIILPQVLATSRSGAIRAWSAGSSSGQEAYSLAITLFEMGAKRSRVLGVDIDEPSLKKATLGVYSEEEVKSVPPPILQKHFVAEEKGYRVSQNIRKMVVFRRGNLLADPYPSHMDLIACRNVMIYFTDKGKDHVLRGIAKALRPGGALFAGATEGIFNPAQYGLAQIRPFFYRCNSDGRSYNA